MKKSHRNTSRRGQRKAARTSVGKKTANVKSLVAEQHRLAVLGLMTACVGHELKNVLTVLQGNSEVALLKPDRLPELAKTVIEQCSRGNEVIQGILNFSGRHRPTHTVEIVREIQKLFRLLEYRIKRHKIRTVLNVPASLCTRFSAGKFQQAILNLLLNAIESQPDGGLIRIHVSKALHQVRILVEDRGPGISRRRLPHIFDPFYTSKSKTTGSGLGLVTTRHIVESAGGHLSVTSKPGQGTRFMIRLPWKPCKDMAVHD